MVEDAAELTEGSFHFHFTFRKEGLVMTEEAGLIEGVCVI